MTFGYSRGWKIIWNNEKQGWFYVDNGNLFDDSRACKRCGEFPTKEGHDACLGTIPNVKDACCGHGIIDPILGDNSYKVARRDK